MDVVRVLSGSQGSRILPPNMTALLFVFLRFDVYRFFKKFYRKFEFKIFLGFEIANPVLGGCQSTTEIENLACKYACLNVCIFEI